MTTSTALHADSAVLRWDEFVDTLQAQTKGIPKSFTIIETLVRKYLNGGQGAVLDAGCETGKHAKPLIEAGYKVTLLDISPKAIHHTMENLRKLGLEEGVEASVVAKIEDLNPKYGPYHAVVGSYVFSFIPPDLFDRVMRENVLGRIEKGGYFAAAFFGKEHSWSENPTMTFVTVSRITDLFESMGFSVCEMSERMECAETVFDGWQTFHTISLIAIHKHFRKV